MYLAADVRPNMTGKLLESSTGLAVLGFFEPMKRRADAERTS